MKENTHRPAKENNLQLRTKIFQEKCGFQSICDHLRSTIIPTNDTLGPNAHSFNKGRRPATDWRSQCYRYCGHRAEQACLLDDAFELRLDVKIDNFIIGSADSTLTGIYSFQRSMCGVRVMVSIWPLDRHLCHVTEKPYSISLQPQYSIRR